MKNKNKLTAIGLSISAIALIGTSFALFSDRAETGIKGKAGNLSISLTNADISNKNNINPGDNDETIKNAVSTTPHDITFNVENTGSKSVRTRHTFIFNVKSPDGTVLDPCVMSILKDKGLELENKKYLDANGAEFDTKSASTVAIKYVVLSDTLNGIGADKEEETDGKNGSQSYKYLLKMVKEANNDYQGASFNLDIIVDAIQFRNTSNEDWQTVSTKTVKGSLTENNVQAVPSRTEN